MKTWKVDIILAAALIVISVVSFSDSRNYPDIASHFPVRLSIVLGILALVLLVKSLIKRREEAMFTLTGEQFRVIVVVVAAVALYTTLLGHLGYLSSSFLLMIGMMTILGFRKKTVMVVTALCTVAVVYAAFNLILGVPLPQDFFMAK
ncbi:MAG: tripartite tricarboxylate transporter TctB family protein [Deltaproteobacteria bacterium]|nr:tripartite tricarboxylate transporter TctB family protein [Deltaproteobacteria bacterium]